ncbi:MAG: hypothetical protein E3J72_11285 [Planctomycetota bacterium]|nr:MAG: hypothetical protein E3J72_11285 [Planctomycetota bacterium]
MSLNLTPSEIKLADRLITGLNKGSRFWRWNRWIALTSGIFMLGIGVWALSISIKSIFSIAEIEWIYRDGKITQSAVEFYIQEHLSYILISVIAYTMAIVNGLIGISVIFGALIRWNRHRRDALIAKVLRAEFDRERRISGIL